MAITKSAGRQEVISAVVEINFGDVTDAVAVEAVDLPEGAVVVGGSLVARTAFNSATSDTMAVAVDSETLLAATNIAATGSTPFTAGTVAALAAPNTVDVTWDGTGAVPTAGQVVLIVNYVVEGRACFSQD